MTEEDLPTNRMLLYYIIYFCRECDSSQGISKECEGVYNDI